ncbi:MAG: ATP-binding protein [Acholeplasmataceae bacterium]|nr:ATP-binding protein [Acholeplasmataceae bacterium]
MLIKRDAYLRKLISRKENTAVKVITGIRRSGKSFLLFKLYKDYLVSEGVPYENIVMIDLDSEKFEKYRDKTLLREYVESKIINDDMYYLFIDEIQLCNGFESLLNGLNRNPNIDIYITGSNSKFLSTDIITEFRGRGDEIRVYPLSFSEYHEATNMDFAESWKEYFTYGGLPFILTIKTDQDKSTYLKQLLTLTYMKDIIERNNLRDENVMEKLLQILASSIGSLNNPKKISDSFNSRGIKTSDITIKKYIDFLLDSFMIHKSERYDVKGKKYIMTPLKFYFSDIGLRNALLNFRQQEENHIMENIIYNELLYRGYNIDVGVVELRNHVNGKLNYKQIEVDFVCNMGSNRYYIQSAYHIPNQEKMFQEERPLIAIHDSFKKIIIVKDDIKTWRNDHGTIIMGLKEFLLNSNSLEK